MQYLSEAYQGLGSDSISYNKSITKCVKKKHGHSYNHFVAFPTDHGYEIDEKFVLIPVTVQLHPGSTPESGSLRSYDCGHFDQNEFLQAWLFFGIIRCVIRKEIPEVEPDQLYDKSAPRLETHELSDGLKKWSRHLQEMPRDQAEMRCIEAVQILTLARRVVVANLGDDVRPDSKDHRRDQPSIQCDQDLQALCLMVLGETLCATLELTMKLCNIDINGWRLDGDGWGPPSYVLKKMRNDGWCPRLLETLKGQLGRSATLLYATLKLCASQNDPSHPKHPIAGPGLGCTDKKCNFIEACHEENHTSNTTEGYSPLHHWQCKLSDEECELLGPDEEQIANIIKESQGKQRVFPLLQYCGADKAAEVKVVKWSEDQHFVTVSHVWAHGLGNKDAPKVRQCQLDHIRHLVKQVHKEEEFSTNEEPLFWLDTLAIPGKSRSDPANPELRQKAVDSIYHVFDSASSSIVIDRHLLQYASNDDKISIGIRLLSSGWMKRLWTLQEAFVTKRLYLAGNYPGVRCIDDMWKRSPTTEKNVVKDSLADTIRLKLSRNIMEAQRQARKEAREYGITRSQTQEDSQCNGLSKPVTDGKKQEDNQEKYRWASLIAGAWTSATYRSVGGLENETFALASLLDLPISLKAVKQTETLDKSGLSTPNEKEEDARRDELMKDFWLSLKNKEGSVWAIPSAIIFTPGQRISLKGFGWAPRTWMSGKDESYPYPLSGPSYTQKLEGEGLTVQYPGIRIHAPDGRYKAFFDRELDLTFPTNAGLNDWYCVKPLNLYENSYTDQTLEELEHDFTQQMEATDPKLPVPQLGIILPRSQPAEFPSEVGLLVKTDMWNRTSQENNTGVSRVTLYSKIIRRLQISRVSMSGQGEQGSKHGTSVLYRHRLFGDSVVGELLSNDQQWCVDGYTKHNHVDDLQPPTEEILKVSEAADTARNTSKAGLQKFQLQQFIAMATRPPHLAGRPLR